MGWSTRRFGAAALAALVVLGAAGCSTTASKQSDEAAKLRSDAADVAGGGTTAPGGATTTVAKGPIDPFTDPAIQAACQAEVQSIRTAISAWQAVAAGDPTSTPFPASVEDLTDPEGPILDQAPKYFRLEGDGSAEPAIVPVDGSPCPAP
jgi:hypothetical protein